MDKPYLENAIAKAGLKLLSSTYFVSISFAVTLEGLNGETIPFFLPKKVFLKSIRYFSKLVWMGEQIIGSLPLTKTFSAGIITAAEKK